MQHVEDISLQIHLVITRPDKATEAPERDPVAELAALTQGRPVATTTLPGRPDGSGTQKVQLTIDGGREVYSVSGAFPSCTQQPVWTGVCLCHARSCEAIDDENTPAAGRQRARGVGARAGGTHGAGRRRGRVGGWVRRDLRGSAERCAATAAVRPGPSGGGGGGAWTGVGRMLRGPLCVAVLMSWDFPYAARLFLSRDIEGPGGVGGGGQLSEVVCAMVAAEPERFGAPDAEWAHDATRPREFVALRGHSAADADGDPHALTFRRGDRIAVSRAVSTDSDALN
jgi:hypothetical protein